MEEEEEEVVPGARRLRRVADKSRTVRCSGDVKARRERQLSSDFENVRRIERDRDRDREMWKKR